MKAGKTLNLRVGVIAAFFALCSISTVLAQKPGTEFVSVKAALQTKANKILISSAGDVKLLKKNLKNLPSIVGVRIDGNVNATEISSLLGNMEDLEQVQLLNFSGTVTNSFLNNISMVQDLVFMIKQNNEDVLNLLLDLPMLNGATFWFTEAVPDNFNFLANYNAFKKIGIIAPLVAKDLPALIGLLNNFEHLEELTISVDRISELPSLKGLPYLKKITIIDNLGWLANKGFTDLEVKNFRLMTDSLHTIDFSYLSDGLELYDDEIEHLKTCVGAANYVPGASQPITAETVTMGEATSKKATMVVYQKENPPQYLNNGYNNSITRLETGVETYLLSKDQNHVIYSPKGLRITIPAIEVKTSASTCGGNELYMKLRIMQSASEQLARSPSGYYYGGEKESNILAADKVFEITFGCKGDQVSLPLPPHIYVDAVTRSDSAMMAWRYEQSEWVSNARYISSSSPDDAPAIRIEPRQITEILQSGASHIHFPMDTTGIEDRFWSESYNFLTPAELSSSYYTTANGYYIALADKNAGTNGKEPVSAKKGKSLIQLSKAYVDRKVEPGVIKVLLTDKTGYKLFPELKAFKNYAFVIEDTINSRRFSQEFVYRKKINDLRIEYTSGNIAYVWLKTEEGFIKLSVTADYDASGKRNASALKSFNKKYKKYLAMLAKRSLAFSNYQNKNFSSNIKNIQKRFEDAKAYEKQNAFIVTDGVYSFASIATMQDSFLLIAKFITSEGLPIDVKNSWVVYPSLKTCRQFEEGNISLNPSQFSHIICKDFDGQLYLINRETLMNMQPQDGGLLYVPMIPISEQVRNMADWNKILSIREK